MQQQRDHPIRSTKSQPFKYSECFYQKHKLIKGWSQPRSNIVDQPSRSESRNNDNLQSMEDRQRFLQNRYKEKQARIQEYQCQINKLQKEIRKKNNEIKLISSELLPKKLQLRELDRKISDSESFENSQKQKLTKLENMKQTREIKMQIQNVNTEIARYRREIDNLKDCLMLIKRSIQGYEDQISYLELDKRGFVQEMDSTRSAIDLQIKTLHEVGKQLSRM